VYSAGIDGQGGVTVGEIALLALVGTVVSVFVTYLKEKKYPEFGLIVGLAFISIALLRYLRPLSDLLRVFNQIENQTGFDSYYFDIILRSLAIAYIAAIGCQVSKDAGEGGIAVAIEFSAKVAILALGAPILLAIVRTLANLIA